MTLHSCMQQEQKQNRNPRCAGEQEAQDRDLAQNVLSPGERPAEIELDRTVGKVLRDHARRGPCREQKTHPDLNGQKAHEPDTVDQAAYLKLAEPNVEQGLCRRTVNEIDEHQSNQERHHAQHRVSGEQARIKERGEAVARKHHESRPTGRERPAIRFVRSFINGHWWRLALLVSRSWLSGRYLRANHAGNSSCESRRYAPPPDGKAGVARYRQAERFSSVPRRSWRTRSPARGPHPG